MEGDQPIMGYTGEEVSMDTVEEEQRKAQAEAAKDSRWRQIADGKTARLAFTGRIFKRSAQYDNGTSLKYDFELEEVTPKNEKKLFSTGSKSKVAAAILKNLKEGHKIMFLARHGIEKSTKYDVSVPEEG